MLESAGAVAISGWLCFAAGALFAAQSGTPKYTNAEVISVNVQQRLLVVRTNADAQQTLELDDQVAGLAELRPGDHVVLTLRGEPGRARVEAVAKASARPSPTPSPEPPPTLGSQADELARAVDSFARRVAELAAQADRIDSVWTGFRTGCKVSLGDGAYEGSHEWLSLWDSVTVDLSNGYCRDLYNQIVGKGQAVNAGMAAAENAARRSLEPGRIREIQKQYALDWSGWGRKPPKLREQ